MRFPGLIIGTATAIALGYTSSAVAEETLNPPAALQEVPTPERLVITPESNSDVQAQPNSVTVSAEPIVSDASSSSEVSQPSEASVPVVGAENSAETTAQIEASPASGLGDAVSVDMKSRSSQCPLKTQMLAYNPEQIAQAGGSTGPCPRPAAIDPLVLPEPFKAEASPALSIYIPVGFGLDGWGVWGSGGFQAGVREDTGSVGGGGLGVALGDAKKLVGLELGYTFIDSDSFGEGGFSGKLHRRIGDNLSIAFGWNGFGNIGRNDFEQSIYGAATYVFHLAESLDSPFSRLAMTVGAGNGQFRTNYDRDEFQNGTGIFGNIALRIIRPVSFIAEWTSQDLALGLSIAPFKNFPFVITPAVRDVTGSGYGARFVIGAGVSFKF